MKRILFTVIMSVLTVTAFSQNVGIGTSSPDPSALLHIDAIDKGLLVPRVNNLQMGNIPTPATGLLVFNTEQTKLFFYNGTAWAPVVTAGSGGWSITGNAGTNPVLNFIGTTDNQPLIVKANNEYFGKLDPVTNNIAWGRFTVGGNTTGYSNIAIGSGALKTNSTRSNLVAIGDSALRDNGFGAVQNYHATNNTAVGSKALMYNLIGDGNTALGSQALLRNETGEWNTAVGTKALNGNDSGRLNTAVGANALSTNVAGDFNVSMGVNSLYNTNGNNNTGIGSSAMFNNSTGNANTALGVRALFHNVTRNKIVAIGDSALFNNGVGASLDVEATGNTAIGSKSLFTNTTGYFNTASGSGALFSNNTGFGNTAAGFNTLRSNESGSYNSAFGSNALYTNTTGIRNVAMGISALFSNTIGNSNVALGNRTLYNNTTRSNLVAVGDSALYRNGQGATEDYHATNNTAIGSKTLFANTIGDGNTAIGLQALYSNVNGFFNTATGLNALRLNEDAAQNTAIGNAALSNTVAGGGNTAVGSNALLTSTGALNTGIGFNAFHISGSLENYTCLGFNAGSAGSSNNMVEIGNTSVTVIRGQVGFTTYSDRRIKDDIRDNVPGLRFIEQLKPVTYRLNIHRQNDLMYGNTKKDSAEWKGKYDIEKMTMSGFLAQDVEQAAKRISYDFSGIVKPANENDLYSLRYSEFVVPLVKAVQEQQAMIDALKNDQNVKANEIRQLKEELNEIKRLLGKGNKE